MDGRPAPARITCTDGAGGSTSTLNGTPSATASAQIVSMLGFPPAPSSWDSVDFAIPARLASSERESPTRVRSRRSAAAIQSRGSRGGTSDVTFAPCSLHRYDRSP